MHMHIPRMCADCVYCRRIDYLRSIEHVNSDQQNELDRLLDADTGHWSFIRQYRLYLRAYRHTADVLYVEQDAAGQHNTSVPFTSGARSHCKHVNNPKKALKFKVGVAALYGVNRTHEPNNNK